ncbi:Predicted NAD/FAD-binding protein [Colwellia chukchiensis]|uniref:Predicted NAD/FAD-binding protein n=1 Tax=Colwellia chukchiensis TaxID=641665 RepID=A0A1H7SY53_9GAMM|nr:FAD-dependent oxidoreductase [Colwellia chukchiensis]SEL76447.1 Predicted NAD/FAD-binding protein [Colwellia chukchiensis]
MKRIAIIGTGISGLTAAYLLSKQHQVSVFEKSDRIGGHTATVDVDLDEKTYAIDTGFIVFNNKTYPNFLALLAEIGMGKQETEMSFSVRNNNTGLEYNGHNLNTLFAQRRNLLNPKFWWLLKEILRFNKRCKHYYQHKNYNESLTLAGFLQENRFSRYFAEHYILPMAAAIWSASLADMEQLQFQFFVQFFHHHGLLNIADRPQWYVIPGGSRSYLAPLCQPFADNIHLNSDIKAITRENGQVQLHFANGDRQTFDDVVLACHSDQALALLADATAQEQSILGAIPYRENSVVLHTDTGLLPKRRQAWASWNYQLSASRTTPASVTYNMNILQGLTTPTTFCVTLNQRSAIIANKILREFTYHHPVFSPQAIDAQQQRSKICGIQHSHFVGAYWYSGFHEDGVRSAVDVAKRFGCLLNVDEPQHHEY